MIRFALFAALVSATLTACASPEISIGDDDGVRRVVVVDIPPVIKTELDLLFVVDNTATMARKQLALTSSFDRLISHLEFIKPDLHIGVVSTDLGVGGGQVDGCTRVGDSGALQSAPRLAGCSAPDERFIRHQRYDDDSVAGNYQGDLTSAFACISQLGTTGCGFEQPLEAMRLALDTDNLDNGGFLRDSAALAVVFLTDEDDCSVYNDAMFDPNLYGTGEVKKFRCFREGVTCKGDDVFTAGKREGCAPKVDSEYVYDVRPYADYLQSLKFDPDAVVVSGMIGDAALVEIAVDLDNENPQLVPACEGEAGGAYPAVRLQSFLDEFPRGGEVSSLCRDEPFSALRDTARRIRKSLGTRCLDRQPIDADPERAGRQPDCIVSDVAPDGSREEIPACPDQNNPGTAGVYPCYTLRVGPEACGDFRTQLSLSICRGANLSPGCVSDPQPPLTHTIGECLVDAPTE